MSTLTSIRKKQQAKPKKDSELLTKKLLKLIDYYAHAHVEYVFTEKALKILCQSKQVLWRAHWLRLRRHILYKLEETK